ncbi:MAG: hypothetical protein ACM3S1_09445, partial [Hyphomicrobiales bacterium]
MASEAWCGTLGAIAGDGETTFRTWATLPDRVELVLLEASGERVVPMERDGEDFVAVVPGVGAGARYRY